MRIKHFNNERVTLMSRFYPALILPKLILPTLLLLLIPVFAGQADSGDPRDPRGGTDGDAAAVAAAASPAGASESSGRATLMVVGYDQDRHYAGSILLIRLDSQRATLRTLQVPGNCYVRDRVCPDCRLGSAFAKGYADAREAGADEKNACTAAADTLADLLGRVMGVYPDGFVSLGYADFADIIDRAGGVDITLPRDFCCGDGLRLPAGSVHLCGADASRFIRFGCPDGEIRPQRMILSSLLCKIKRDFSLPRALALGSYAYRLAHSDLEIRPTLILLRSALSVDLSEARIAELSGTEQSVDGQLCQILPRDRTRDLVNYYLDAAQSPDSFDPSGLLAFEGEES